jgi:hypothetical protein
MFDENVATFFGLQFTQQDIISNFNVFRRRRHYLLNNSGIVSDEGIVRQPFALSAQRWQAEIKTEAVDIGTQLTKYFPF